MLELSKANLENRVKTCLLRLPTNNYDANQVEYVALIDYTFVIPTYDQQTSAQSFCIEKFIKPSSLIRGHDALQDMIDQRHEVIRHAAPGSE